MKTTFESLPADLQETLLAVSRGTPKKGYHAFSLEGIGWKVALAILGLGLMGLGLANVTDGWPSWNHFTTWIGWITGGLFAFTLGTIAAIALKRGKLKPFLIVTPGLAIKIGRAHEAVHLVRLDQVTDVSMLLKTITILRGKDRVVVDLADAGQARIFSKIASERCMAEDDARTQDHRLLKRLDAAGARTPTSGAVRPFFLALAATTVAAPLLIGGLWVVRANLWEARVWEPVSGASPTRESVQRYEREAEAAQREIPWPVLALTSYDSHAKEAHAKLDDAVWGDALRQGPDALRAYKASYPDGKHAAEVDGAVAAADAKLDEETFAAARTPDELRAYRTRFPQGKHVSEVDAAIAGSFERNKNEWVKTATSRGAPAGLIAVMTAMFDYVQQHDAARVTVTFARPTGAEEASPRTARNAMGELLTLHPLGPTFEAAGHYQRENELLNGLRDGLRRVLRVSGLEVVRGPAESEAPHFEVTCAIEGTGRLVRYGRGGYGSGASYVEFSVELGITLEAGEARFEANGNATASPPQSIRNEWDDVYPGMANASYGGAAEQAKRKLFGY